MPDEGNGAESLCQLLDQARVSSTPKGHWEQYLSNTGRSRGEMPTCWIWVNTRRLFAEGPFRQIGGFVLFNTPLEDEGQALVPISAITYIELTL
jgi:hypothetical protein